MNPIHYLGLACLFLFFNFSCSNSDISELKISSEQTAYSKSNSFAPVTTEKSGGNSVYVELCKEILPVRPDFKNLGQCVKLFAVCGESLDPQSPNFPVCICEIFELNGLLGIFGYENYGQCVSD